MGILSRAADIISSNINAVLDRAEDPVKMAKKYLADYMDDLAECKRDTATILAQEKQAQRAYDEVAAQVEKYSNMAMAAVRANDDESAAKLIAKMQTAEADLVQKKQLLDAAHANSAKMTQVYNKLVSDIEVLRQRVNNVEATAAIAKGQEKVAGVMDKYGSGSKGADGISRMEQKAQAKLDRAEASVQLGMGSTEDADLEAKYGSAASACSASVQDELARMKASLAGEQG